MPSGFTVALNGSSSPSHPVLFSHLYDIFIAQLVTFAPSSVCSLVSHPNGVMSDGSHVSPLLARRLWGRNPQSCLP